MARQLRVSEEEAGARLQQLELLLPNLGQQVEPAVLARLAMDVGAVTRRLLQASGGAGSGRGRAAPHSTAAPPDSGAL